MNKKTGLLLVNLGTPDEPEVKAVKKYLKEFLSDPRVVEMPRLLWWIILNGFILRFRPAKSAKAYQSIWMDEGSPLLVYTQRLAAVIKEKIGRKDIVVDIAMRYGKPSIASAIDEMHNQGVTRLVVLPLYPQYSSTTTATVNDAIHEAYRQRRVIPELVLLSDYHDNEAYISALATRVRAFWDTKGDSKGNTEGGARHLLLSFHGLPAKNVSKGDPYYDQCVKTAELLAQALQLESADWSISFQSRLGRVEWIKPYTSEVVKKLAHGGTKHIDVFCPGFPVDCLETLEEIAVENRAYFMQAGGESYRYISALNDSRVHANALVAISGIGSNLIRG